MLWIGALISAGASLASGLIGKSSAQKTNDKQIGLSHEQMDWNEQMMDKQNAFNRDMWNATNEYNTPANQRQRLLDAGINPLGADMSNQVAQNIESASTGSYSVPTLANPTQAGIDSALATASAVANIRKTQSETKTENQLRAERLEQLKSQNDLTRKNITSAELSNVAQEITNKYLDARESALAEGATETVKLTRSQKNYVDYQTRELKYRIEEILPHELQSLLKNNALTDEKILSEKKNREHIDAVIKEIGATIGKISAETGILENDLYYYFTNHMSNGFMGTGLSIQNVGKLADQTIVPVVKNAVDKAKNLGSKVKKYFNP